MLDSTVVTLALPAIGEDLDASTVELQWLINGYLLTIAVLTVTAGRLGDMFGRRLLFVIGLELRPVRLWAMRSAIFGLGTAQLVVTSLALAAIGTALGLSAAQALFIALAGRGSPVQRILEHGVGQVGNGRVVGLVGGVFALLLGQRPIRPGGGDAEHLLDDVAALL